VQIAISSACNEPCSKVWCSLFMAQTISKGCRLRNFHSTEAGCAAYGGNAALPEVAEREAGHV
jgi:hypothetical protein